MRNVVLGDCRVGKLESFADSAPLAVCAFVAALSLFACTASPTAAPIHLQPGQFTALGGVQKNSQPTASDFADLQSAENGTLNQPALVEFYADY